jgi:hypothetical protein
MRMERTASKESVMNRLGLCVVIIAALSAISFPVGALMLGSAPSVDAIPTDIKESVDTTGPALSPEGKSIRVISLSVSDRLGNVPPAGPEMSARVIADVAPTSETKRMTVAEGQVTPAVRPVAPIHLTSKRRAAAAKSTRAASAAAKNLFVVSGLR